MTAIEIPADLIDLKREFIRVDHELAELSRTMPPGKAIIAGEAVEDPADRARWNALYDRLGTLVEGIRRHPAFEGLSQVERHEMDAAASKAARASSG